MTDHVAVAETEIDAAPDDVWSAITDPSQIERYMFGSHVESSWEEGGHIVWKGRYEGREFADHGKIVEIEPPRRLKLTHFSPESGKEDLPENYHTILYELEESDGSTKVRLSQDNNQSPEEAEHSRANWQQMLAALKQVVEAD